MPSTDIPRERGLRALVTHHPVTIYFVATFALSWAGALAITERAVMRGECLAKVTGLMMFPIMLLGPCLAGVALTGILRGANGLKDLLRQMRQIRLAWWYASLLIP